MKNCANCGKGFKLGFKDKFLRKRVDSLGKKKGISLDFAKDYCNKCWKTEAYSQVKGVVGLS